MSSRGARTLNVGVDLVYQKLFRPMYDVRGIGFAAISVAVTTDVTPPAAEDYCGANAPFGEVERAALDNTRITVRELIRWWDVDKAQGHVLDRIGKLLNEKRNGDTDDRYSMRLKLRVILNTNDGSVSSIINAIQLLTPSSLCMLLKSCMSCLITLPGLLLSMTGKGIRDLTSINCLPRLFRQVFHSQRRNFLIFLRNWFVPILS